MNVQFKKGSLEMCVLIFIHAKDRYGYELAQQVSESIQIADGTLYPLLRRLTKDGFLSTYFAASSEGPQRKYYTITSKGKEKMHELIDEWEIFTKNVDKLIREEYKNHE
ncbi:PadR family transcriptional regulator [Longirhabdus pacifica]|uniref:PadR family transcriptional regulator n=1 Tax=Longirhabdus pacifica TaxID=2305227 RepID=UPI00100930FC|nr:PadR family transcriptional regulator [Longirhabdus pacifica]